MMADAAPLLSIKEITKKFTGITAVDHVSFDIGNNEIHALIGENGAGKSTLCKMLTGEYNIDEGHIEINGEKMHFKEPADSMKVGISMVYQERNLVGYMTAAQNVFLGSEPMKGIVVDQKEIQKKAEKLQEYLGVNIPLDVPVEKLGAGEQQLVEIMRANSTTPQILILDEPTNGLDPLGIEELRELIRSFPSNGITVILSSHILSEVQQIADHVGIIAGGVLGYEGELRAGEDLEQLFMDVISRNDKDGY